MTQSRRAFLAQGCAGAAVVLAGCTGGDASDATLSVESQSGDGETLTIDEVSAEEEYYVAVRYGGAETATDSFEAGSAQESIAVDLSPAIQEATTAEVAVLSADSDAELASTEIEYQVEPEGSLTVEDQQGAGRQLTIQEASANVSYVIEVIYGGETITTDPFEAGTTQQELTINLSSFPPGTTPVDVRLIADETSEELASETIEYDVVADLFVQWDGGEGEFIVVESVSADVDYYLEVQYRSHSVTTDTFEAGTTQRNLEIDLEPPLSTTRHLNVVVRDAETGDELASQSVQYKYRGAVMEVQDQSGDGQTLDVDLVEATPRFYVAVTSPDLQVTSTRFPGGSVQRNVQVDLGSGIDEATTLHVAVHADNDDEELYSKDIEYTVE